MNWTTGVSYGYDGSGNVHQIGPDRFVYDKAGRLVQAQVNGVTRVYTYDAFGNRTGCTHGPGTPELSDCQFGQTIDSSSNRVKNVQYDDAGNVRTYQGHTYTYDAVNMPVRDDAAWGAKEFIYTADDERIATHTVGSSWNWTVRDVYGKVLREFASDSAGNFTWTRDHVYRDGLLLASVHRTDTGAARHHYHLDHLGTPRRVTNQNNRTVGFHDYYAFGPEISGGLNEPNATPLQYTGHERDKWGGVDGPETLDYMHASYYSPALGRFLSLDPGNDWDLRHPQSWNLYAYVRNNPMNRTDPTGRCGESADFVGPGIPCAGRGAQGAFIHAGATTVNDAAVRQQYTNTVSQLSPTDSAARTQAKIKARAQTSTTGQAIAESMRPMANEAARVGGTASRTNPAVNQAMATAGRVGKVSLVAGATVSVVRIATAEEGQTARVVAQEGGAWAGALAFGAAGAKGGAVIGSFFGPGPGTAIGGIIGGIGGGIFGAIVGEKAGDNVYQAAVDEDR